MDDRFTYEKRSWYPHLRPGDVAIWERFIEKYPIAYDEVQYDVNVGSPPPFDPTVNPETGGEDSALYKRKIDVVGFTKTSTTIMEIKPRASMSTIGQVLGYVDLYKRDVPNAGATVAMIVTDRMDQDALAFAQKSGVVIIQV
jgi:hypothetical protein